MKKESIRNLTVAAMMLALGMVLPYLTGQIPAIGNALLPMHIPVLLCGFVCGWQYGLAVGLALPLLRSLLLGMPSLYPIAIAMAFELGTYGFLSGFLYSRSRWQCVLALYRCLLLAMLGGRVVLGLAEVVLLGIKGNTFTWSAFFAGAFLNAIPGILIQLLLIPAVMLALHKTGLVKFKKREKQMPQAHNP